MTHKCVSDLYSVKQIKDSNEEIKKYNLISLPLDGVVVISVISRKMENKN